jgi:hypothetical protein
MCGGGVQIIYAGADGQQVTLISILLYTQHYSYTQHFMSNNNNHLEDILAIA